jgi:hypothetical protein
MKWRSVNEWCKINWQPRWMNFIHLMKWMLMCESDSHWMNFHRMNVVQYMNMTTSIWDEILWIKVNFTSIAKIYGWILWSRRRETFVNFNCWVNFNHYISPSSIYTTLTQWPFSFDGLHASINNSSKCFCFIH